ncbi:WecB/TagA/CpsF family glycosyltransferase [Mycobacterium kansasii]|uniref:N-acetylmannosaminyltransferase n=4 Tax=Mycobacterium kansasii TaxID=1768 RepID=A0A653F721_MYCKA|nr:WecB/TagA/CpsF family glycosyltransferase [Mycobacterium kansasii]AGZ50348.1 teichoic acid biosynthesis protein [Mycobacterium kansasii ATCC 12478]EUA17936.1 glycosyltransferase, WecB/TagA/CpsF family protein [Mycobacterium kansasii 662]KEP39646.1 teichoic acid biosynthesis protein [Mycobacterium kansasii]UCA20927.1 WecB/TagA/CpsF family glycosyltransferase [Mycobacterium kansasii]UGT80980.1 WecB/TagA/CpsF family glycosyltransferase [Mycobacterium kansasii]
MSVDTLPETGVRMIIGGTIVERREFDDVLSIIASRLQSSPTASLAVGSVNLDHLYHFRKVMSAPTGPLEWLLLADGMPIAWRGQLLTGKPWPRVTGADLLPGVLALAETTGQRVGFFGGSPETHRLLAGLLRKRHPALAISGMWAPDADDIESLSERLAATIRTARTDILIVSLGKPRQEQWVDRYGCATGARVLLPCGGAIDFLAGKTIRAPGWMQKLGLEWLHRLISEPRRLARRYLLQGPIALLRTARAQLICYPSAGWPGTPPSDRRDISGAVRDAARPEPATV